MTQDREKRPDDIDSRLEQLSSKLGEKQSKKEAEEAGKGLQDNAGMAYGLKIASEFVSAIIVGSAIGWVLDTWLGTTPFGLIVFLIMGFAAGILNVMRATGKMATPKAD